MSVDIRNAAFRSVVGDTVEIEKLATGFLFTEGPLWHAKDKYLLFSDMPGDHMPTSQASSTAVAGLLNTIT